MFRLPEKLQDMTILMKVETSSMKIMMKIFCSNQKKLSELSLIAFNCVSM